MLQRSAVIAIVIPSIATNITHIEPTRELSVNIFHDDSSLDSQYCFLNYYLLLLTSSISTCWNGAALPGSRTPRIANTIMKIAEQFTVPRGAPKSGIITSSALASQYRSITGGHPASALIAAYRGGLQKSRTSLLREIRRVSCPLADVVANVLKKRDESNPPSIGEVWPWLVGDLARVPKRRIHAISKAWLAIYVYTMLLDRACDEPRFPHRPTETLAGALVFEIGLGDFCALTSGTSWQNTMRKAVRSAIRGQEVDVRLAGRIDNLEAKRRSAAGKNAGFAICTAAIAAASQIDGTALDRFARSILLSFQHLDDIADFESDLRAGNYTTLLVEASGLLKAIKGHRMNRFEMLEALLRSGALRKVLVETQKGLTAGLRNISNHYGVLRRSISWQFFDALDAAITKAIDTIDRTVPFLDAHASQRSKRLLLENVDRHLVIVAQSS